MLLKPNILFLVIDSLRSDKVFGNKKASITPNINLLMKKGTFFTQAISSADGSSASLASIFTSLYPFKTGVGGAFYNKLHSSVTTYFTFLMQNGYNAYAMYPKVVEPVGLTQNFKNNVQTFHYNFRLSDGLGTQIIGKLKSEAMNEPWIMYVHLMDLHVPLMVPKQFNDKKYGSTKYDQIISAIDVWIGKILQYVNMDNTIIILTADHGEYVQSVTHDGLVINLEPNESLQRILIGLGNLVPSFLKPLKFRLYYIIEDMTKKIKSGKISRLNLTPSEKRSLLTQRVDLIRYLYDDLVRVPLIFAGYGIKSDIVISQQVRHIDIFPTIAEIIGLGKRNETEDGKSLVPLFNGDVMKELPAYIENTPDMRKLVEKVIGIRTSDYKFFRGVNNPKSTTHLYDLKNDPLEENNIANIHPDLVENMEKILTEIRKGVISLDEQSVMADKETQEIESELKKLGYI